MRLHAVLFILLKRTASYVPHALEQVKVGCRSIRYTDPSFKFARTQYGTLSQLSKRKSLITVTNLHDVGTQPRQLKRLRKNNGPWNDTFFILYNAHTVQYITHFSTRSLAYKYVLDNGVWYLAYIGSLAAPNYRLLMYDSCRPDPNLRVVTHAHITGPQWTNAYSKQQYTNKACKQRVITNVKTPWLWNMSVEV